MYPLTVWRPKVRHQGVGMGGRAPSEGSGVGSCLASPSSRWLPGTLVFLSSQLHRSGLCPLFTRPPPCVTLAVSSHGILPDGPLTRTPGIRFRAYLIHCDLTLT